MNAKYLDEIEEVILQNKKGSMYLSPQEFIYSIKSESILICLLLGFGYIENL